MMQIPNLQLHSWFTERLPDMLWAALLTQSLPRAEYMRHLSLVAKSAIELRDRPKMYPSHSATRDVSRDEFDILFGRVLGSASTRSALSPLLLFDGLPARDHWAARLPPADETTGWSAVADAIAGCLDRRSRPSIDLRWLRVIFLGLQHRLVLPQGKGDELVATLCDYPQGVEDPGLADATIGSLEMATAQMPGIASAREWSEFFWRECWEKTGCILPPFDHPKSKFEYEPAKERWGQVFAALYQHFFVTLQSTDIDPRHDAVFGLALVCDVTSRSYS